MKFEVDRLLGFICIAVFLGGNSVIAKAESIDPLVSPATQSPLAARSMLTAVTRTPDAHWVTVGRRGHILLSRDAYSWQQAAVPVSTDLVSVYFADALHGWAVGHGGMILATADGGKSWRKQLDGRVLAAKLVEYYEPLAAASSDPDIAFALDDAKRLHEEGPGRPFLDVWFHDEKRGYAVGAYNLIFATEDGGTTWVPQSARLANPKGLHLNAIRAIGNDVYIVAEQGLLARLNPATGNFDILKTPYAGSFFGIVGKEGLLVLFGLQGNVYRSTDKGINWQKLEPGLSSTIASGTVLDDGRLVLASQNGRLAVSADNGNRFKVVAPTVPGSIFSVAPGPGNSVVLVGGGGVRTETLQ